MNSTVRQWEGLKPVQFSDVDLIDLLEGSAREHVSILEKLKPNECYERTFRYEGNITTTQPLERYLSSLREAGLNIGRGEAEFGYRMPLPGREASSRKLIIFRRG